MCIRDRFQPAPIDTRPPVPYAHTERKPYPACLCTAYKPPVLIRLSRRLSAGLFSYLHEQSNGHTPSNPGLDMYQQAGPVGSQATSRAVSYTHLDVYKRQTSRVISCQPSGNKAVKPCPACMPYPSRSSRGCGSASAGSGSCICAILSVSQLIDLSSFP